MAEKLCRQYKIVYENGTGEVIEKKSRFIGNIYKVKSEEEITAYINEAKKKYWDARHNCYAYVLGENDELKRCSDDGEPSGTAGKPMLDIITANELHNCLVIVTRYFGGTLLGTGGLVRAYQSAVNEAINNAIIIERKNGRKLEVRMDYNGFGKVQYIVNQMGFHIIDTQYSESVEACIVIPDEEVNEFKDKVIEATAGNVIINDIGMQHFCNNMGRIIIL